MGDRIKEMLSGPIELAEEVGKLAEEAQSFKQECKDLKKQAEKLGTLLREAACSSGPLYERPTLRIMEEVHKILVKALLLVSKCRRNGRLLKTVFAIASAATFRKMSVSMDSVIVDVHWLLNVSGNTCKNDDQLRLPPIATADPMLGIIWQQIARLQTASVQDKIDAATCLGSLAGASDRKGKLIVEEGGIPPLLKLAQDKSTVDGQDAAAKAIGLLARNSERVEQMIHDGVASVFVKLLKDGPMKVQGTVAWALSEMVWRDPEYQNHFANSGVVRPLVVHLAFEAIEVQNKYAVRNKNASIHSLVNTTNLTATNRGRKPEDQVIDQKPNQKVCSSTCINRKMERPFWRHSIDLKGREREDPSTKASIKAQAARALWKLATNNPYTCKRIIESKALLCFAMLLEKSRGEVQLNTAMAVTEIAAVAEHNTDLRRAAFKMSSPAAKSLVDQLRRIVIEDQEEESVLVVPCLEAIGSLAHIFPARETGNIIWPLVKHLDNAELSVAGRAAIALGKFGSPDNYLHVEHCKAIIQCGGPLHLIRLIYSGEGIAQIPALVLLCYLAIHVGDSATLAKAEALSALEWASKQISLIHDPSLEKLLPEAKARLELSRSRPSRLN